MAKASLTISSKQTHLLLGRCAAFFRRRMAGGLRGEDRRITIRPPGPSFRRFPRRSCALLEHGKVKVWDTLAIGEYLNEIKPEAGLLPADPVARAHCRAVCGEMHSASPTCARRCQ